MRPSRLILALLLLLAACGSGSPTGLSGADAPDRLVIVGPYKLLLSQGTASYRAFAQYADGRPMVDVTDQVSWSSDDEATFTVDGGQVTLNQGGVVPLRAQLGDQAAKLSLTIVRRAGGTALPLVEGTEHLPTLGQSTQLTASLNFPDGQPAADVTSDVTWESSDPAVLDVDIFGKVTAVGAGEAYVIARYGTTPGALPIVAGPMPATSYDVTVIAIRLNAQQACENDDEGDAEFSYEFSVTTSSGESYTIAATNDYPSSDSFALMADEDDAGGLLNIEGQASFVLSEVQSFELRARVTEWDLTAYYFGDWFPDPEADDLTETVIHRGSSEFDRGLNELTLTSGIGCNMQFEYRVVVTER